MATHDYVISNASGAAVRADLNNALAAIVSNNSNATEPSTTYAYQWWADIGSSPAVMKLRNAANDGWITLFQLDGEWSTIALEDGTAAAPSLYFKDSGTDTGIYSSGTDEVAISTGGTSAVVVDASQRLLVGTSTSASAGNASVARIQVVGNSTDATASSVLALNRGEAATAITSGEAIGNITFGDSSGNEFGLIQCVADANAGSGDYPGRLVFSTTADSASSPTERMRIDNQGRIQATCVKDNNAALVVNHNGTSATQYGVAVITANDQNSSALYFLNCVGGTTARATIRTDGGLANYSANNANLSDRNAKKDISPASDTWDCIKEWEIVNYRYKDQLDDADLNLGVIAQQVAESCPEVITVFSEAKEAKPAVLDDDGNEIEAAQEAQSEKLGIKEQQMYWMAIKALQEAQVRIETLEAKVAALEAA